MSGGAWKKLGTMGCRNEFVQSVNCEGKGGKIARIINDSLGPWSTWLCVRKSMSLLTRRAGNHCQETSILALLYDFHALYLSLKSM